MKKSVLCLALSSILLAGCSSPAGQEGSSNASSDVNESESTSSETTSSKADIHIPEEMIGRWYIISSSFGILPLNGIFDICADDTLEIGERTLELAGHYASFDEAYLFTYGTINFVVSYDSSKEGIDWGYINGESQDLGFASSEPLSDNYDYEGDVFPMDKINEYLGTSGSIKAMESSSYRLKLFVSSLNNLKCASVEVPGTTLKKTMDYIADLIEDGYSFPAYGGTLGSGNFAIGYDASKTYLVRIIFFSDESEADIFIYNYDEALLPKESSEQA